MTEARTLDIVLAEWGMTVGDIEGERMPIAIPNFGRVQLLDVDKSMKR